MISGIKRKKTAIESSFRFFQTIDLIISHFKRDADKEMIFELLEGEEYTLKDILVATAAIHLYHNIGIRVKDALELRDISVDSTKKLELIEKKMFFEEVQLLLKNSFSLECDMLYKMIDLEDDILSLLIKERETNLQKFEEKKELKKIQVRIEDYLMNIIMSYPPFYFYDLIGDLIGLTDDVKVEIMEESSAFKDLSVEIEKKLESEEKEDKFIEISTLNRLIDKIKEDFEFKSYKELKTQAMPVRMIKKQIINYNIDKFPISVPGLKDFIKANKLKRNLIQKIENYLHEEVNYEKFENEILAFLRGEIINELKSNPNDFVYFLQNLNECDFSETIFMLSKYGLYNILEILNLDDEIVAKVKQYMVRYNIDKYDVILLNDSQKNLIYRAREQINKAIFNSPNKIFISEKDRIEKTLLTLITTQNDAVKELWDQIEGNLDFSLQELREFIRKKEAIDKYFLEELGLNNYSQLLLVLSFDDILDNIVKEIFYYLFSKILRQLGRIIESYQKIINDKALFLIGLKKISGTNESEEWVRIKLEELIIKRILRRQEELVVIFNAINDPFLVNGFILAHLRETSIKEGISELENEESAIYEDIAPLSLKKDLISPISYCISYDLLKRFESSEELRKLKIEQIAETKAREKEKLKKDLRKKQEISTLNWIERRITSSLMRINSPGINPNQLYWNEKDFKITSDNIKLHSELDKDVTEKFSEFFTFAINKIKEFNIEMRLPDEDKIKQMTLKIINTVLSKRLGHSPEQEELNDLLEGERFDIAKQIAKRIGKILDKALYTKFKNKRRNA